MPIIIPVDFSKFYQGQQAADNQNWQDARNSQNWDKQQMQNDFTYNTLPAHTQAANQEYQFAGDDAARKNEVGAAQQGANVANAQDNTDAATALRDYRATSGFFPSWAKASTDQTLSQAQSGAATSAMQNDQSQADLNSSRTWNTAPTTADAAAQQANIAAQQGTDKAVNEASYNSGYNGETFKGMPDEQIETTLKQQNMLPSGAKIQNHQIIQPGMPPVDVDAFFSRASKVGAPAISNASQQVQDNARLGLYKAQLKERTDAANNAAKAAAAAAKSQPPTLGGVSVPGAAPAIPETDEQRTAAVQSYLNGGSPNSGAGAAPAANSAALPDLPAPPQFNSSSGFVPFTFNTQPQGAQTAQPQPSQAAADSQAAPAFQPQAEQPSANPQPAPASQPAPKQTQASGAAAGSLYPAQLMDTNAIYTKLAPEQKQQIDARAQQLGVQPQQLAGLQARQNWTNSFKDAVQKRIDAMPDGRTKTMNQAKLKAQIEQMQRGIDNEHNQIITPAANALIQKMYATGAPLNPGEIAVFVAGQFNIPLNSARAMVNQFNRENKK